MTDQKHIRNFCIIAHIDHGKSTLADRILEMTDTVQQRDMKTQLLDDMELERERGITIKLNAVQLSYHARNGEEYLFNLIDTPGHVDFSYEVSRSLAACEGAVLVVDSTQGVQAQTLANTYLALDNNLEIIPVINKVDMNNAQPDHTKQEIEDIIGLDCSDAPLISARSGLNVDQVLEQIVEKIPSPSGDPDAPLQALVFDSFYDPYRGVIALVRIREGSLKVGDHIRFMETGAEYEVLEAGIRNPKEVRLNELMCGDVGWFAASIKDIHDVLVGDTVTCTDNPAPSPLEGYRKMNPMVYCGLYPSDAAKYQDLHDALDKLQLNDASLQYEPETSQALGFGFRCGFLGLLHMDVIQERLEREYNLDLIATAPSVICLMERCWKLTILPRCRMLPALKELKSRMSVHPSWYRMNISVLSWNCARTSVVFIKTCRFLIPEEIPSSMRCLCLRLSLISLIGSSHAQKGMLLWTMN